MARDLSSLGSEDIASITAAEQNHANCVLDGDFDALAPLYARDVVMMPPNQPDVRGWEAVRQLLDRLPRVSVYEVEVEEVDGCGDCAYARGTYSLSLADGSLQDTGRWLHVLRRQLDGSWVVTRDIFSSDRPVR
ncbi:MAG: YybH family protein [Longimicrobiales bacterium]